MSYKFPDRAKMSVSGTPGTGDVGLNTAISGYQTLGNAGLADGDTFPYVIEDGSNWEIGVGTYHSSGPSFTRTTVRGSSGGGTSKITATSNAIIYSSIMGEDIPSSGTTTLAALTDVSVTEGSGINGYTLNWNNATSKWTATAPVAGGAPGGTSPAVVQSLAHNANGTAPTMTLGAAPTNGNYLVAIVMTDGSDPTVGSGWTLQASYTTGTWYKHVYTKVAGASESATQVPVTGGSSSNWAIGMWEVSGQNATTPLVLAAVTGVTASVLPQTPILPVNANTLCLFSLVSTTQSNVLSNPFGCQTVDSNLSGGSGAHPVFGHSNSSGVIYSMAASQGSSVSSDAGVVLITH